MAAKGVLHQYFQDVERERQSGRATEHSFRPALKALIESMADGITATNEPKKIECGAPDLIVTQKGIPLGHIEAKNIGKDLGQIEKGEGPDGERFTKYLDALPNLILTDYLEFRWYVFGAHRLTARADSQESDGLGHVQELLRGFIEVKVPTVRNPQELAKRMAGFAKLMKIVIRQTFNAESKTGTLHTQLAGFRKVLIETLTEDQFADMYAQTICYGLFAARCNHDEKKPFTREKAAYELPKTNPFLRELFGHIAGPELDERITWVVDDLAKLLDRVDIKRILKDFGKRTRREDPVVHFYETFLKEYDSELRELRGVYYTPEPVVSYIVRSVDYILKRDFKLSDGIADYSTVKVPKSIGGGRSQVPKVTILDPAVGTGTFLHEVVDHIHDHVVRGGQHGVWNSYVSQFLLPRIFGFEFLMAPYAVCHLKLGLQLSETGYDFKANERLRVYLTNTLEEAHAHSGLPLFTQALAREALEAGEAKQDYPVMVVLGNPPYSGHSANKGQWIHKLLRGKDTITGESTGNYFKIDGRPLDERNPKWLNDDYVKFIRFAQWRIERTGYGILAFISNHGYLDNPTFRGMRQSLMNTFDDIYVLDLHGNAKKKEKAPDGTKDENVFDIQQGVAIGIFVKNRPVKNKKVANVYHSELWGTRETFGGPKDDQRLMRGKYYWLWDNDVSTTTWEKLKPESEWYLFKPINKSTFPEYMAGWKITDIMPTNSLGITTARDRLTIHLNRDSLFKFLQEFSTLSPAQVRTKFRVKKDSSDWKIRWAQSDIKKSGDFSRIIKPISYRPFDMRVTAYTGNVSGFMCRPRQDVMRHMIAGENVGISTTRSVEISRGWEHVFCFSSLIQLHSVSIKEVNYLFPLYLYPNENKTDLFDDIKIPGTLKGRRANLSSEFIKDLKSCINLSFVQGGKGDLSNTFGPEDVLNYIYAVLHAPSYRARYTEYLDIDFPRLPKTTNKSLFHALCDLGGQLVGQHLMHRRFPTITAYPKSGGNLVEKVKYAKPKNEEPGRIWINQTQFFEGVPVQIWNFHIGGYQICERWLKDRKGRNLSFEEIQNYQRIVSALSETIRIMAKIDNVIEENGGWPIQ